jgi:four helix bundle protein
MSSIPNPEPAARLDAEKLQVYAVALEFQALAATLLHGRRQAALRDQLDRASVSIVLNVSEGAGRFAPGDKARFYAIARGSAMECGAILDVLLGRRIITNSAHRAGRNLVLRIVQMLTKLHDRMARDSRDLSPPC